MTYMYPVLKWWSLESPLECSLLDHSPTWDKWWTDREGDRVVWCPWLTTHALHHNHQLGSSQQQTRCSLISRLSLSLSLSPGHKLTPTHASNCIWKIWRRGRAWYGTASTCGHPNHGLPRIQLSGWFMVPQGARHNMVRGTGYLEPVRRCDHSLVQFPTRLSLSFACN